jgi:acetylornithine/N-succinyldiaminopimelate aminotransferase
MNSREEFITLMGQTNPFPLGIHVERAEGIYFWDKDGKRYTDMISGISVTNIGHRHPNVISRIKEQLGKSLHVMVYGEFVHDSNLNFAKLLVSLLPHSLNAVYPVNSGTEAIEASLKLAKRFTNRTELIAFKGSYHGSTHGSMSVSYNEVKKSAYRPLLPDVQFLEFNNIEEIQKITTKTAGVIIEPIQGDAGVRIANTEFLSSLKKRCDEVGALLIFDEIQCGMGRSGKLFAFEHSGIIPDILVLGKALGGGVPIGAFVTCKNIMKVLTLNPMLGHITTFGGNPLITSAALGCLEVLRDEIDFEMVERNGQLLEDILKQSHEILEIRRHGLMFACDMKDFERVDKLVKALINEGIISFWFLSHPYSFRLSPPLTITSKEITEVGITILNCLMESSN